MKEQRSAVGSQNVGMRGSGIRAIRVIRGFFLPASRRSPPIATSPKSEMPGRRSPAATLLPFCWHPTPILLGFYSHRTHTLAQKPRENKENSPYSTAENFFPPSMLLSPCSPLPARCNSQPFPSCSQTIPNHFPSCSQMLPNLPKPVLFPSGHKHMPFSRESSRSPPRLFFCEPKDVAAKERKERKRGCKGPRVGPLRSLRFFVAAPSVFHPRFIRGSVWPSCHLGISSLPT